MKNTKAQLLTLATDSGLAVSETQNYFRIDFANDGAANAFIEALKLAGIGTLVDLWNNLPNCGSDVRTPSAVIVFK